MKFGHKGNLRLHRQVVHEGRKIKCDLCDYQAAKKSRVEEHKKTDHEGIRYKCDKCNFETKVRKYLQVHTKRDHDGQVFQCTLCDYSSKGRQLLKRHESVKHEGVKYNCDQCAYSVTSSKSLKRHMSDGVHKVQSCGECNELFEDPERLVRHLLKHEGKKPFPCDRCEASCTTLSNLQRHQRTHDKSAESQKKTKDQPFDSKELISGVDLDLKTEPKTEQMKSATNLEFLLVSNPLRL